jgi:hypothetical protein
MIVISIAFVYFEDFLNTKNKIDKAKEKNNVAYHKWYQ